MTPAELDAAAKALYDACWTVKPKWEQLGDATKSVWRERVIPAKATPPRPVSTGPQQNLF